MALISNFQSVHGSHDLLLVFQEKWNVADLLKILNYKLEVAEETFHFALPPLL